MSDQGNSLILHLMMKVFYGSVEDCVPDVDNLREEILEKAHFAAYSVHPGVIKMCHRNRDLYWQDELKKNVAYYESECLTCQQVKAEHQKPSGKLQPLPIPEWK